MKLKDQVVIISGGGTGIGKEAALLMAKEGAKVVVCGRRPEPLSETVALIKAQGGEAIAVPTDVTKDEDIANLKETTMSVFGRVDVLVNNAGTAWMKPFMETTMEDFDYIYRVDLRSVFAMCKAFVPVMLQQGKGNIINISSILGVFGGKSMAAYCAAKGGVNNLTRALAAELGPKIRVNCLCPSHIDTAMMEGIFNYWKQTNKWEKLLKVFPLKRVGYPADVANAILFFASEESAWITGQVLVMDGGMSCFV